MTSSELLERMAKTLRTEVGPAVEAEYPRTQAFLCAVVLHKLAGQLRLAPAHAQARARDRTALVRDLEQELGRNPVGQVSADRLRELVRALGTADDDAALCALIEALYRARSELGEPQFATLLARVRSALRADLDRRLEYAS